MKFRNMGDSGLKVSLAGLGCNNFGARIDAEAARKVVHAALDFGITLFDSADIYGAGRSEEKRFHARPPNVIRPGPTGIRSGTSPFAAPGVAGTGGRAPHPGTMHFYRPACMIVQWQDGAQPPRL